MQLVLLNSGFAVVNDSTLDDPNGSIYYGARYRDGPVNQTTLLDFTENSFALMASEVKLTIDKFDGTDWNYFKHQVEVVMKKMKIWNYLITEETQLKEELGIEKWSEDDSQKAYATVFMSLTKAVQPKVWGVNKPHEMWKILKDRYEIQSVSNKMSLTRELIAIKQEDGQSIDDLFNVLNDKWNSLKSAGKEVSEEDKICKLLEAVNDNFTPRVYVIEATMNAEEKIQDVLNKLLAEEKRLLEAGTIKSKSMALNTQGKNHEKSEGYKTKGKSFKCHNCGKLGHFARDCRSKKRSQNQGSASVAFMVNKPSDTDSMMWLLDSGATFHMTREFTSLTDPVPDSTTVTCAGGQILTASAKGTVNGTINGMEVKINDVYYFPEIKANLLSVNKMSKSRININFGNGKCEARLNNGKVLFRAQRSGNMFTIRLDQHNKGMANAATVESLQQWHEKLGHRDINVVKKMLKEMNIKYVDTDMTCESCIKGKQTKEPLSKLPSENIKEPLEVVSTDVWGPARTQSKGGSRYYVTFTDHSTRHVSVYFLKSKDGTGNALKEYLAEIGRSKHKVISMLSDRGGEFTGGLFRETCLNFGIKQIFTAAYTPQQNGMSERMNLTLMNTARTLLDDSGLPDSLWAEAVAHSAFIYNHTKCMANDGKVPASELFGKSHDLNEMHKFGTKVFVHVNKQEDSNKLTARGQEGYFVGFSSNSKCYRIYLENSKNVVESRDVKFLKETNLEIEEEELNPEPAVHEPNPEHNLSPTHNPKPSPRPDPSPSNDFEPRKEFIEKLKEDIRSKGASPEKLPGGWTNSKYDLRERRNRPNYAGIVMLVDEPNTYSEAMKSSDHDKWEEAMKNEIDSLQLNETFDLVDLPEGRKPVSSKWVFKKKFNKSGEIDRFKARLVARGFSQVQGIDYEETFSPVVKIQTVLAILALVNAKGYEIHQMDVDTAFLYGSLEEEIYLKSPEGFDTNRSILN